MKKTFLKFLPLMAAVLLATSCSKDEDNNDAVKPDTTKQANTETEQQGVPFTIKVVTGKKLSKIGYEDKGATVQPSFSESDVDNLEMKLSPASDPTSMFYGYLTLKNVNGTFKGELWPEPEEGTEILVELYAGENKKESSTESLTDLMENCQHKYKGTFTYGSDDKVMLTDQNAYFEIFMSPLQHKLFATMYDEDKTFEVNKNNGKVWIVVEKGHSFKTNFYSKAAADVKAGEIYTIDRSGYVDLGLSDGTLWADKNVGATSYDGAGNYYTWNEAVALNGITLPEYDQDQNIGDFRTLWDECSNYNVQSNSKIQSFYFFHKNCSSTKDRKTDPYIILPAGSLQNAEGTLESEHQGEGCYWTKTAKSTEEAYRLRYYTYYNGSTPYFSFAFYDYANKTYKQNVRAILRKK